MIDQKQLRKYVVRPVLKSMGYHSDEAEDLLMLTCAQESAMGRYLHQIEGPALGIYQMEPATHDDIWDNYLWYKNDLAGSAHSWSSTASIAKEMVGNLNYATVMARCHYLRVPEAIPTSGVKGLAEYWKEHYNTYLGAGTVEEAIENYEKYVIKG